MSSDTEVRRVLQEIVDARLRLLRENEHTGHLYVHFKAGRIRTVEWRTLDSTDVMRETTEGSETGVEGSSTVVDAV